MEKTIKIELSLDVSKVKDSNTYTAVSEMVEKELNKFVKILNKKAEAILKDEKV